MASRPERAFRIADRRFPIFDGTGAFLNGGRWNSPGRRVIYASETYPGAVLEVLAHTRIGKVPRTHEWVEIAIPPHVSVEDVDPESLKNWDAPDFVSARQFGDEWLRQQRILVLIPIRNLLSTGVDWAGKRGGAKWVFVSQCRRGPLSV